MASEMTNDFAFWYVLTSFVDRTGVNIYFDVEFKRSPCVDLSFEIINVYRVFNLKQLN